MTGCAIWAQNKLDVGNLDIHANGSGITLVFDYSLDLERVTITDYDADGITYVDVLGNGRIVGDQVTVNGNGGDGIRTTGKVRPEDAEVRDNGGCPSGRSRLFESTCAHSSDLRTGGTFAICTLD